MERITRNKRPRWRWRRTIAAAVRPRPAPNSATAIRGSVPERCPRSQTIQAASPAPPEAARSAAAHDDRVTRSKTAPSSPPATKPHGARRPTRVIHCAVPTSEKPSEQHAINPAARENATSHGAARRGPAEPLAAGGRDSLHRAGTMNETGSIHSKKHSARKKKSPAALSSPTVCTNVRKSIFSPT